MLATFIVEIAMLLFVVARHSLISLRVRLAAITLLFLATFQLAEYNVCGGMGLHAELWSRIGFVVITMLPPLGLHLILAIAGKRWNKLMALAYGMGAAWAGIFAFSRMAFRSYECGGNYAIFQLRSTYDTAYLVYYFMWLIIAIALAMYFMNVVEAARRRALEYMVIGYLLFVTPTAIIITLHPEIINGLPSVMCGFAVLYALVITFGVVGLEKKLTPASKTKKTKRPAR